ncbi:MAG: hypothetical protein LH624_18560 [Cryobacterium sp.]|nr:hypothetical protein [Cryobacterium sp.]
MALLNDSVAHKEAPSMHFPMNTIRDRIQQDLGRHLDTDSILDVCKSIAHTWRKTILNPVTILHLFLLQVLHGNTSLQHVSLLAVEMGRVALGDCLPRAPTDPYLRFNAYGSSCHDLAAGRHTE